MIIFIDKHKNMEINNQNISFLLDPRHKYLHLLIVQLVMDGNCVLHIYFLNQ